MDLMKTMSNANNGKLRVGLIGLGKMGMLHASLLSVLPNVQLVGLCDKSRLMRFIAKRILDGPLVTDNLSKFSDLNLDAVYVTTPIPSHYNVIKEIFERNLSCNVFTEKTLSSSYSKSKELLNLATAAGGVTMVGYMKRFSVTFNKVKQLLNQKSLGDLLSFEAYAYSSDFADVKHDSSMSVSRGGVLEDLGSHVIDLALWFFEDLTISSAEIQSLIARDSVDLAKFKVSCSNDLKGSFVVSWVETGYRMPEFGFSIKGTDGSITVDDSEVSLNLNNGKKEQWYRQDLNDTVSFLLGDSEFYRENENFISCIVNHEKTKSDFQTAVKVDNLLEQVERIAND